MKNYDLYGIGAALVDTEIETEDAFLAECSIEKGVMTLVDEARQHELMELLSGHLVASKKASGGSAANSIIAAANFGAKCFHTGKVSSDDLGDFYLNDLKNAGVDASFERAREDGITGKCLVMISPDAERTMNTFLGISETLDESNLDLDALAASEWLYIEGYLVTSDSCRGAAIKARQHAEANGVKTALSLSDPGMVQFFKEGLNAMLGDKVDLLFCNKEEAFGWADTDNIDDAVESLKQISNTFAITLGAEGAVIFDGEALINIAPNKVTAIDTNGAGDAFAGALLYGLSQGFDFAKAGKLASLTSATVVSQYGPRLADAEYKALLANFSDAEAATA
ncbi:2-dehydro-3-deoxygluconokinase [BD1-7 clade bacterium]|uniref:2-dehydro-3-deoxygluconokinase n=1 Tax=BD1-7 clade bacterium TaxID=2029982 RepID=A0A5S9N890_9GAMM|nr:2-dehydro-3-deoxygluconokinase [BD1-7 clade bacterium]CAA0085379.1 2-dehydro-3-deoxygluconokinase [BD1-7 clade bacterium]